ncbi:hypothetical protein [Salipiger sp. CCB-MM3]|uniref:hypothetical protein n=1 Tax=Salipiger sp. CCB-MM3 TaxID=1792508 RepID=UPI0012FB6038|nr:hypothetical protein [Salipiger sp. CCB-MM3]
MSATQIRKITTVCPIGTKGLQLAQGEMLSIGDNDHASGTKSIASIRVGKRVVEGELLAEMT